MMALRLKKDVQKASYYVFFLGAQESKELRGDRVLLSTIPRLIERAGHLEPLKVTLQISHKGLKIIQGSAKHFIPHNAITCSIVSEDIVACVMLLYNPVTKCPLHVHAYRCDSDTTANALQEQLQILIRKPENQKKFAELEVKLEKSLSPIERSKPLSMPIRKEFDVAKRRFDSSLGSDDTGTSTRESECSEDQHSPIERPPHLFDSLAAELRAKLNGGTGPPLLLPPRDYDTISRSQGSLAAVDLRRCQNLSIVGKEIKNGKKKHQQVPSHGSSGIGSDLAPSPERIEEEISTSSSEGWKLHRHEAIRKMEKIKISPSYAGEKQLSPTRYGANPPSYIFPKEPSNDQKDNQKFREKSMYCKQMSHEDDHPIIAKKQVKDNYIHDLKKKHFVEAMDEKFIKDDRKINGGGLMRQQSERYRHSSDRDHTNFTTSYDNYERENLTDRQKYREIIESKKHNESPPQRHEMYQPRDYRDDKRDYSPENIRTIQRKSKTSNHEIHGHVGNPYREPESLPYRESIESMMKSPVMKYKSRHGYERRSPPQENFPVETHAVQRRSSRDLYIKDSSPMSTMKRTSPKDRFQDAKEKFQAMDKLRMQKEMKEMKESLGARRSEPIRREEKDYRQSYSPEPRYHAQNEWSSEEEFPPNVREYREVRQRQHHQHQQSQRMVAPAKSLGNLTKGYRHSYAEPLKYCNRVGLAAIEPY